MIETFGSRGETSVSPLRVAVRNAGPDGRAGYAGGLMRRQQRHRAVFGPEKVTGECVRRPSAGRPKTASRDPATVPAGNSLQDAANSLLGLIIERFGEVVAHPILGGLHYRYARI